LVFISVEDPCRDFDLHLEPVTIEIEKRIERLVLGWGGDVSFNGKMADLVEELFVLCGGMARFRHGKITKG
jgi:hypothetical protein